MRTFRLLLVSLMALAAVACATPKQPPLPVGNLNLGRAYFTQPQDSSDMLAGYMSENVPVIESEVLTSLDGLFGQVLAKNSKNTFTGPEQARYCARIVADNEAGPKAALHRWSAIGRCMNVDILVVPQAIEWQERDGSTVGVVKPAKVVLDFFVLDVKNSTLISRSHFDETQTSLSSNLLEAGKFFKRGGKWVSGGELAQEGMERAVKDLGL